jgi:hypothetical protein
MLLIKCKLMIHVLNFVLWIIVILVIIQHLLMNKTVKFVTMDTTITMEFAINVLIIVNGAITKQLVTFVIMIHIWISRLDYVNINVPTTN